MNRVLTRKGIRNDTQGDAEQILVLRSKSWMTKLPIQLKQESSQVPLDSGFLCFTRGQAKAGIQCLKALFICHSGLDPESRGIEIICRSGYTCINRRDFVENGGNCRLYR
jgi:hypothetical protein